MIWNTQENNTLKVDLCSGVVLTNDILLTEINKVKSLQTCSPSFSSLLDRISKSKLTIIDKAGRKEFNYGIFKYEF